MNLELNDWQVWLASEHQGTACLHSSDVIAAMNGFCVDADDLNSSLDVCVANTIFFLKTWSTAAQASPELPM